MKDTLRLHPGKRLHLVLGSPYREALGALGQYDVDRGLWHWIGSLAAGDLILTAVDSNPRMFVALERLARSTGAAGYLEIADAQLLLPLVPVAAVRQRLGRRLPRIPGPVPEDSAHDLLTALEAELAEPTPFVVTEAKRCESTTRLRSTGLQAKALAESGGLCAGCERDIGAMLSGRGYAALDVHHLDRFSDNPDDEVETTVDRLIVVCGACHGLLHARGRPSLQDVRFAWRPACPECTEQQAQPILWGMPDEPPAPDVYVAGCLVPERAPEWHCGHCGYRWTAEDEPELGGPGDDFRDVLRSHWPAPRGGGSVYNFGSNRYLIAMLENEEGYRADYWLYDVPGGADLGVYEPVDKGPIIGTSTLRDMCIAVEDFIHQALGEEDEGLTWP